MYIPKIKSILSIIQFFLRFSDSLSESGHQRVSSSLSLLSFRLAYSALLSRGFEGEGLQLIMEGRLGEGDEFGGIWGESDPEYCVLDEKEEGEVHA
jgi:hypothetical protein